MTLTAAQQEWLRTHHRQPRLVPIKNGWAAHGDGWAVHGVNQEDARMLYAAAEARHAEIATRHLPDEPQP